MSSTASFPDQCKEHTSGAPVCVLILNWNGAALLRRYLPSVLEHTPVHLGEVVVADNGSSDDSLDVCHAMGVRTIALPTNLGFAGGYNAAIAQISHPYVCLLNSDVRVSSGWLSPLIACIEQSEEIAAVQPKLRSDREPRYYEYAGAMGGYMDYLGYPYCRGRLFGVVEEDTGQYDQPVCQRVFWTTGACMLVRRSAYVEQGGLAEHFFAHQEEIDLAWRWNNAGYRLYALSESVVYHYGGASLDAQNPRKTYLNFRNNLLMLYRNLPQRRLRPTLLIRTLLDLLAAVVFLLQRKPSDALAVVRAHLDAHSLRRQEQRPSSADAYERGYSRLYHRMLLWRFHVYREQTYDQLRP